MLNLVKNLFISMRPWQWYKNFVIFIALIFSQNILNILVWEKTIFAFIVFCLLSGAMYLINDLIDLNKDKLHPKKKFRPLASEKISPLVAVLFVLFLFVVSFSISFLINFNFVLISLFFVALLLSYSLFFKNIFLADVIVLSIGFVVRAVAGCLSIDLFVSQWLFICTFLLALLLSLSKRRAELALDNASSHRKVLSKYSIGFVDQLLSIVSSSIILSYLLYSFSIVTKPFILLTIPFVVYCVFRYNYLVQSKGFGSDAEKAFLDKGLILSGLVWAVLIII